MTPLPKPTPALRRMRRDNPIPMTSAAYLRHINRRPAPPTGRPTWGARVAAAAEGSVADEVDAGYLAAIRLAPRLVGTAAGQVPQEVAGRLFDAGLIRRA